MEVFLEYIHRKWPQEMVGTASAITYLDRQAVQCFGILIPK